MNRSHNVSLFLFSAVVLMSLGVSCSLGATPSEPSPSPIHVIGFLAKEIGPVPWPGRDVLEAKNLDIGPGKQPEPDPWPSLFEMQSIFLCEILDVALGDKSSEIKSCRLGRQPEPTPWPFVQV